MVTVEITGLWDVIVCSEVDKCHPFEGTFCLRSRDRMENSEP